MFKPILLLALAVSANAVARPTPVPTRYGKLAITDDHVLTYKGKPLEPTIQGNSGLSVAGHYKLGASDVVLLEDEGGSACPAQYIFVTVTVDGAQATSRFGTCDEIEQAGPSGDAITVTMRGYAGPFEPEAARVKARHLHMFMYRQGQVAEIQDNGY